LSTKIDCQTILLQAWLGLVTFAADIWSRLVFGLAIELASDNVVREVRRGGLRRVTGAIITPGFECIQMTMGTPLPTSGVGIGDDHGKDRRLLIVMIIEH
jgi:hypothetical protein